MRVKSGIPGFDRLVQGGFPAGSCILLKGDSGVGKTIFGLQFCILSKDPTVFVSLNQSKESLLEQASQFGWKPKKFSLLYLDPKDGIGYVYERIVREIERNKAKRFVLDSLSVFTSYATVTSPKITGPRGQVFKDLEALLSTRPSPGLFRVLTDTFINEIRKLGVTSILISEGLESDRAAEFSCDGIISLEAEVVGERLERTIRVVKMRKTKIDGGRHSLEIGKKGIKVGS